MAFQSLKIAILIEMLAYIQPAGRFDLQIGIDDFNVLKIHFLSQADPLK